METFVKIGGRVRVVSDQRPVVHEDLLEFRYTWVEGIDER